MKKLLAFLAGCAADREQPAGTDTEASLAQSAMTKERWTDTDGTALDYWLYTPENPAEVMPLIVYLHGGSGKGNDLKKILDEGSLPGYLWSGQLSPAVYVLIPQLPESCKGWTDRAEALMKLISHVEADCAIDSDRVSLTGHSMGGTGAVLRRAVPVENCSVRGYGKGRVLVVHPAGIDCGPVFRMAHQQGVSEFDTLPAQGNGVQHGKDQHHHGHGHKKPLLKDFQIFDPLQIPCLLLCFLKFDSFHDIFGGK